MGFLRLVAVTWALATIEAGALSVGDTGKAKVSAGAVTNAEWKWPWQKRKIDTKKIDEATILASAPVPSSDSADVSDSDEHPARPQMQAMSQDSVDAVKDVAHPSASDDIEQRAKPQFEVAENNEGVPQTPTPTALTFQGNGGVQSLPATFTAVPVFRSNSTSATSPQYNPGHRPGLNPVAPAALLAPRNNGTSWLWQLLKPAKSTGNSPGQQVPSVTTVQPSIAALFSAALRPRTAPSPTVLPAKRIGNSSGQQVPVAATLQPAIAALFSAALRPRAVPPPTMKPKRGPLNIASLVGRDNNATWPLYPSGKVPGHIPEMGSLLRAKIEKPLINKMCKIGPTTGDIDLVKEPSLKPFLVDPNDPRRTDAAVVIAPGGGNMFLAWEREGTTVAEWLNSFGVSAFVLKYRVPGDGHNTDGSLMDAQRAMSMVRSRAAELGLNQSRIGFMGFSAAGYLADRLSSSIKRMYKKFDEEDEANYWPNFQMVVYGGGPSKIVGHRPPPTLVVHAQDDPCGNVRGGTAYCEAVRRDVDQICERLLYPNGGHGYGTCALYTNSWSGITVCDWINKAENFIRRHMLGSTGSTGSTVNGI